MSEYSVRALLDDIDIDSPLKLSIKCPNITSTEIAFWVRYSAAALYHVTLVTSLVTLVASVTLFQILPPPRAAALLLPFLPLRGREIVEQQLLEAFPLRSREPVPLCKHFCDLGHVIPLPRKEGRWNVRLSMISTIHWRMPAFQRKRSDPSAEMMTHGVDGDAGPVAAFAGNAADIHAKNWEPCLRPLQRWPFLGAHRIGTH
jgi:hypothetical protein